MSQDARFDEEQSTQRRARILGMNYVDTSKLEQKAIYKEYLSIPELYSIKVIPLAADESNLSFGVTTTTSQQTMANLRQRFQDQRISFSLISNTGFHDYMKLYDPPKQVTYHDITLKETQDSQPLVKQVSATLDAVRADDMLAYLVQQASKLGASDIHIENQKNYTRIRFRIDGVLHPIAQMTHERCRILISAIASAGNISTSAYEAQQGHIAHKVRMADGAEVDINLRVETVPAINGMDIVMRLFTMRQDMYKLDKLGLSAPERKVLEDIIKRPSGLVLAVGPTGSGKTTTLYSILNSLSNDERKIITIEDPVEYQFEGVTQISVTSHNSQEANFAEKLRATLRLDPDIVMVGEIRDADTAKTALQAALTGHLVLSTFHAASAAAALTRLLDIIGENPLFVSAIRLIMAQRLVRRIDKAHSEGYKPDSEMSKRISGVLSDLPGGVTKPDLANLTLYKPVAHENSPYGYSGQLALREQLLITDNLRGVIQSKGLGLSIKDIEEAAKKDGMMTMQQDGILKALNAETTIEEVFRVLE